MVSWISNCEFRTQTMIILFFGRIIILQQGVSSIYWFQRMGMGYGLATGSEIETDTKVDGCRTFLQLYEVCDRFFFWLGSGFERVTSDRDQMLVLCQTNKVPTSFNLSQSAGNVTWRGTTWYYCHKALKSFGRIFK